MGSATILGTHGRLRISSAHVGLVDDLGNVVPYEHVACDLLLMSGGWTPSVHLYSQSRGKVVWNEEAQAFLPGEHVQRERCAAACSGSTPLWRMVLLPAGMPRGKRDINHRLR
jgi:sarcosine oxidase subunit alpha